MRNKLQRYARKVIGKNIDTDGEFGSQCVDLIKHYTQEVMGRSLGTFGGSAKTGWANKSNTFSSSDWNRIENNFNDPDQIPSKGDIIFFNTGEYGHVGIVYKAYPGENKIDLLNQNTGNADGYGADDAIKIQQFGYKNVSGWYSPRRFWIEYKGLPVFIFKQPVLKPRTNASYSKRKKAIALYTRFFLKDEDKQIAILEHEYAHHIYYKLSSRIQRFWKKISTFDKSIQDVIEVRFGYTENAYVSKYAKKNYKEDFAETWEYIYESGITYGNYADLKVKIVTSLMEKYGK